MLFELSCFIYFELSYFVLFVCVLLAATEPGRDFTVVIDNNIVQYSTLVRAGTKVEI